MIYALVALGLVCAGLVWELHKRDRRIEKLLADNTEERRSHDSLFERLVDNHRQDIQVWANRVQAPDVAVAQSIDPGEMTRQFTMYDDDDDLVKAFKELD